LFVLVLSFPLMTVIKWLIEECTYYVYVVLRRYKIKELSVHEDYQ